MTGVSFMTTAFSDISVMTEIREAACNSQARLMVNGGVTLQLNGLSFGHDSGAFPPMSDTVVTPGTRIEPKVERPRLHKVILINDDYTPREFVVVVLKGEFRMTEDQAYNVMITAHKKDACVVAVFTRDVAETKATRATEAARAKGYPLMFTTEPEE
jgi:ATP-dependent Clp protease adaptor protein ClpS